MAETDVRGPAAEPDPESRLLLRLDGFEGPLDLLLELARGQKLDLAAISIRQLVDQYLAVIEGARRIRIELAAEWLVMAAWLAWLKSRLLLPDSDPLAAEAGNDAEILAARLAELQMMRQAAGWLGARAQLGQEVFRRGAPEDLTEIDRSALAADLPALIRAYLAAARRTGARRQYRPMPLNLWSLQDALRRLRTLLGSLPDWTDLAHFLPERLGGPLERKAAMAATLLAGLELARDGQMRLRQEQPFGPIQLRPGTRELPPEAAP